MGTIKFTIILVRHANVSMQLLPYIWKATKTRAEIYVFC